MGGAASTAATPEGPRPRWRRARGSFVPFPVHLFQPTAGRAGETRASSTSFHELISRAKAAGRRWDWGCPHSGATMEVSGGDVTIRARAAPANCKLPCSRRATRPAHHLHLAALEREALVQLPGEKAVPVPNDERRLPHAA